MKKLLLINLITIPFVQAMDTAVAVEAKSAAQAVQAAAIIPEVITKGFKEECIFQARSLHAVPEIGQLFTRIRLLDALVEEISFNSVDSKTSAQWQSLATHLKSLMVASAQCHNVTSASLSAVSCFGISARQCYELMSQTRGSDRVLQIFREGASEGHQKIRDALGELRAIEHTGASGLLAHIPYILESLKLNGKGIEAALEKMQLLQAELCVLGRLNAELVISLTARKEEAAFWNSCVNFFAKKMNGEKCEAKTIIEKYITSLSVVFEGNYKAQHGKDCDKALMHKTIINLLMEQAASSADAIITEGATLPALIVQQQEKMHTLKRRIDDLINPFRTDRRALLVIQGFQAAQIQSLQESCTQPLVDIVESVDGIISPLLELLNQSDRTGQFIANAALEKQASLLLTISIKGNEAKSAAR